MYHVQRFFFEWYVQTSSGWIITPKPLLAPPSTIHGQILLYLSKSPMENLFSSWVSSSIILTGALELHAPEDLQKRTVASWPRTWCGVSVALKHRDSLSLAISVLGTRGSSKAVLWYWINTILLQALLPWGAGCDLGKRKALSAKKQCHRVDDLSLELWEYLDCEGVKVSS